MANVNAYIVQERGEGFNKNEETAAGGQEDAGNEGVSERNRAREVLVNISDVPLFKDDEPPLSTPE